MTTRKTSILTFSLMTAAALAFSPGTASAEPNPSTHADLDGDGTDELVTVEAVGTHDQQLVVTIDGEEIRADAPADAPTMIRPPRVVDLDGDGREELAVRETFSNDTHVFGVWYFADGKLRTLGTPDGHQLRLYEGGDDVTSYGYGCAESDGNRTLITMNATEDDAGTWSGSQDYYMVNDGIATSTGGEITFRALPFVGPSLTPDGDTCG